MELGDDSNEDNNDTLNFEIFYEKNNNKKRTFNGSFGEDNELKKFLDSLPIKKKLSY